MKKSFVFLATFVFLGLVVCGNLWADDNATTTPAPPPAEASGSALDRIAQKQDEILKKLDEIKAELEIVKIRASDR